MLLQRFQYGARIADFLKSSDNEVLGQLTRASLFNSELDQTLAWFEQISILKNQLEGIEGDIFFEFDIPRMGKRIDNVLISNDRIFVIEFKVGESEFPNSARDQVWDYALDLRNFHETSHDALIVPILICTEARDNVIQFQSQANDNIFDPICIGKSQLSEIIRSASESTYCKLNQWIEGRYKPTPTILEAAKALYAGNKVEAITRSDAGAKNLTETTECVDRIIVESRNRGRKSICFVTGVPGAGKTLVGLNIATKHSDATSELHSVYLSGNGPLVKVLTEALARDRVLQQRRLGKKSTLSSARSEVKAFIQIVHHFRDACLRDMRAQTDRVVLFDEAQRAWDLNQTASFMKRKKNQPNFAQSEPEFLISCMDRHDDWAVIVCLVGGGQEINTGEAGIVEWIAALNRSFPTWDIHISSHLTDSEHNPARQLERQLSERNHIIHDALHLNVNMRSFRSEHVSHFVKSLLDIEIQDSTNALLSIASKFPILLCRDLSKARKWLDSKTRGTERCGIVVSSNAERLKPVGVFVKSPIDPVHWFLEEPKDNRSSNFLEDVATEFDVQGLELDWTCVVWDADFRYKNGTWQNFDFRGSKWQRIVKSDRQSYQKNAYRVLLTRARQGMVIVVPEGNKDDPTRLPEYYDGTYNYLLSIGLQTI
jgi:hypothetical protein